MSDFDSTNPFGPVAPAAEAEPEKGSSTPDAALPEVSEAEDAPESADTSGEARKPAKKATAKKAAPKHGG